jgi:AraC-like DNA-binding protein
VRSSLADAWLEDPRRSITEIGLDLGYTDAANFARAYRRTNGQSPSAARRQRLGSSACA